MGKVKEKAQATEKRKLVLKRTKGQWVIDHLTEDELLERAVRSVPIARVRSTIGLSELNTLYWTGLFGTTAAGLKARLKKPQALSPAESERFQLFEQVYARGVKAFGNEEKFKRWMEIPSSQLEHKKPRDLMKSTMGLQRVMGELEDIAYGTYA